MSDSELLMLNLTNAVLGIFVLLFFFGLLLACAADIVAHVKRRFELRAVRRRALRDLA